MESIKDPILIVKVHAEEQTTDRKIALSAAVEPRQMAIAEVAQNDATTARFRYVVQRHGDSLPVGPSAHLVVRHTVDIIIRRWVEESHVAALGVGGEDLEE